MNPIAGPLQGRNAIVTGGASGIGLAISRRLAREGAKVAIFDVDAEAAAAEAKALRQDGFHAVACAGDVTSPEQVTAGVGLARSELGPLHILVNNAGIECIEPFVSLDLATWERVFAVNVTGMFHCTQAVIGDMIDGAWGRVINISSSSAQRGAKGMAAYAASKGAVISFTRALALEFGGQGITVNNIPPGFIVTPMLRKAEALGKFGPTGIQTQVDQTPVGRAGIPEDIAACCAFLASPDAGYITGQTVGVNGGRVP